MQIAEQENDVRNDTNYLRQGFVQDVGTQIATVGDVRLQAGGNLNATAAAVSSETAAVAAIAEGDVTLLAGQRYRRGARLQPDRARQQRQRGR